MKRKSEYTRKFLNILYPVLAVIMLIGSNIFSKSHTGMLMIGHIPMPAASINGVIQAVISLLCILIVCTNRIRGKKIAIFLVSISLVSMSMGIFSAHNLSPLPGMINTLLSLVTIIVINRQFTKLQVADQFHEAVSYNAMTTFTINLTKNQIEEDFFVTNEDGTKVSVLKGLGLSFPCSFTDFAEKWDKIKIPEISKWKTDKFKPINQYLMNKYKEGVKDVTLEYWAFTFDDQKVYLNTNFLMALNHKNELVALCTVRDFTKYKLEEDENYQLELEEYAYKDPVTDGYNYNIFKVALSKQETSGYIICVDIQSFKVINSICGIAKADEILKSVWEVILAGTNVEKHEFSAHVNADRYVIYLPTSDQEEVIHRLKRLTIALNMLSEDMDVPFIQPYFGISSWTPEKKVELSYSEAIAAKDNIRDLRNTNYAFFNDEVGQHLINQKIIVDQFQAALENEEFEVWFQPKYSPEEKKLIGAEALVRWKQTDGSYKPPVDFIPIFEKNNMIRDLDEYVFKHVCIQLRKWLDAGKNVVPISVNISRSSLYYKSVASKYRRFADDLKINTKLIPIEITESAAVENNEIKEIADALYDSGFALQMDDFGTGYSSLASLNTMHFETLKLDKSIVDYIGNFGGDRLITHTISLAKELGMHITAEGVENKEQVSFLRENGCDSIQGFFYSKPIPTNEFEKLL